MQFSFKLSRTSWIILIAGILVVAFGSLGVARFDQFSEEDQLKQDLAAAEKRLEKSPIKDLTIQKKALEDQLAQSQSRLDEIQQSLDRNIANIDVTSQVINIVHGCNLTVVEINSVGVMDEKLVNVPCLVDRLEIVAAGDVDDLVNLVVTLNNSFDTGMVESAEIINPELEETVTDEGTDTGTDTSTDTGGEGTETDTGTEITEPTLAEIPQITVIFAAYTYNGG
jgi:hypothetical protein